MPLNSIFIFKEDDGIVYRRTTISSLDISLISCSPTPMTSRPITLLKDVDGYSSEHHKTLLTADPRGSDAFHISQRLRASHPAGLFLIIAKHLVN